MDVYMERIRKALELGIIDEGAVTHINIAHDGWCGIYGGGECNCNPEITIPTSKGVYNLGQNGMFSPASIKARIKET